MKNEEIFLEVSNPVSVVPKASTFQNAPRLGDLNGKTIGEWVSKVCQLGKPGVLSSITGHWRESETFPLIEKLLKERFPNIKIIPGAELPGYEDFAPQYAKETSQQIKLDHVTTVMKERKCDAVILGNGA